MIRTVVKTPLALGWDSKRGTLRRVRRTRRGPKKVKNLKLDQDDLIFPGNSK